MTITKNVLRVIIIAGIWAAVVTQLAQGQDNTSAGWWVFWSFVLSMIVATADMGDKND